MFVKKNLSLNLWESEHCEQSDALLKKSGALCSSGGEKDLNLAANLKQCSGDPGFLACLFSYRKNKHLSTSLLMLLMLKEKLLGFFFKNT